MTAMEFMVNIQKYYGAYTNELHKKVLLKYLLPFDPGVLRDMFDIVLEEYSTKWKTVPDLAIIKELVEKYDITERRDRIGNVYKGGLCIGVWDGYRTKYNDNYYGQKIQELEADPVRDEEVLQMLREFREKTGGENVTSD